MHVSYRNRDTRKGSSINIRGTKKACMHYTTCDCGHCGAWPTNLTHLHMPHRDDPHRQHHQYVRQLLTAAAERKATGRADVPPGGRRRSCETLLGCRIEYLRDRLGYRHREIRHVDHIVPLADGGTDHFTNLRMLSPRSNMTRGRAATVEEHAAVALLMLRYPPDTFYC